MNFAHFAGHIGQDAEYKPNVGDKGVCNFSVAVKVGYGEREHTLWIACALWGTRGERLEQYLLKGTAVAVCGKVDLETFEKRDGTFDAKLKLDVAEITLQGKPKSSEGGAPSGGSRSRPEAGARIDRRNDVAPAHYVDDDIPF